jgi:hypothetical protein
MSFIRWQEHVSEQASPVRERYGVEVEVGQRVVIDGTPAVVVRGEGDQYLHFTPNGGRNLLIAHPTWRVDYHPEA